MMTTAKPKSDREKAKIEAAKQKKYPQMYDKQGKLKSQYKEKWTSKLKRKVKRALRGKAKAGKGETRKQREMASLRGALSKEEIERLK